MHVCVDIQAAIARRTGVGRYVKALVEHLGPAAGADRLTLFYFDFLRRGAPFPVDGARQRAVHWMPGRLVQKAWKTLGAPPFDAFAGAADLYHFPNFIRPPLRRGKSVVTLHDLAFLRLPDTVEEENSRYLSAKIRETVERADAIIAVSRFTAAEIEALLAVPPERVAVIPEGLEAKWSMPAPAAMEAARSRYGLNRPYLLSVGTIEPRKNYPFLVDVFERLAHFDGDLVLAGMCGWKFEPILARIAASPRAARIRRLDYVPEELLPGLYAGAEMFVLPSLYEGFGFPPLEAMACGTPAVLSACGSLPEIAGDAALLLRGFAADDWAARIEELLADPERRRDMIRRGLEQAARFSWTETARLTWDLYRKVAG